MKKKKIMIINHAILYKFKIILMNDWKKNLFYS